MAIKMNEPTPQPTPAPSIGGAPGGFRPSNELRARNSFTNFNAVLSRPLGRAEFSEIVTAYYKAFGDQLKAALDEGSLSANYRLTIMNHAEVGTPLTMMLLTFEVRHNDENYVGVFSYVVEASNNPLARQTQNLGNRQITVDVVSGDVLNAEMWEVTKRFLQSQYGSETIRYINTGGMVLPREMDLNNKGDIHTALYQGTQALYTMLDISVLKQELPFSVTMLSDKSITVQSEVVSRPVVERDVGGLPIRNDLGVETVYVTRSLGMLTGNATVSRGLTKVGGYIDFEYVPNRVGAFPQPGQPGYNPYAPPPTQVFVPRYVTTILDTQLDAVTPETILLAYLTEYLLCKNKNWSLQFRHRPERTRKKGEIDWRDIGALGYAVNIAGGEKPEKVDTTAAFGDQELANLLQMAVYDEPVISIDIEETGGLAWIHQMFIASANGDQNAYDAILQAANNLTNNQFGHLWAHEGGGAFFVDENTRVHMGYYIAANDERRDIRELDRLAIYNLFGGRDRTVLLEWDRSWYDMSMTQEERLDMRRRIAEAVLSGYTLKGMARRGSFTSKFLSVLTQACANAGLIIQQVNIHSLVPGNMDRPAFSTEGVAMRGVHGHNAGVFSMGGAAGNIHVQPGHYTGIYGYNR